MASHRFGLMTDSRDHCDHQNVVSFPNCVEVAVVVMTVDRSPLKTEPFINLEVTEAGNVGLVETGGVMPCG